MNPDGSNRITNLVWNQIKTVCTEKKLFETYKKLSRCLPFAIFVTIWRLLLSNSSDKIILFVNFAPPFGKVVKKKWWKLQQNIFVGNTYFKYLQTIFPALSFCRGLFEKLNYPRFSNLRIVGQPSFVMMMTRKKYLLKFSSLRKQRIESDWEKRDEAFILSNPSI